MPPVCFLAAWKETFVICFVIPVASLIGAGLSLILQRIDMRIGLIAMSGVRACDAELMEVGLTLPGVVGAAR